MRKAIITVLCSVFFVIALSFNALAFYGDTIGVGMRAISLGEAFVGVADDYSATFYNPAGLGQIEEELKFTLDWIMPYNTFKVTNLSTGQDLAGEDFEGHEDWNPTESADDGSLDSSRPTIGLTANLTKICSGLNIPVNLTLGMVVMIPDNFSQPMTLGHYVPDIPQFVRFGDVEDQLTIVFSLGVEALKDKIYLGLGAQIKIAGDGDIHNESGSVDLQGDNNYLMFPLQIDWRVWGELSPIIGVLYTPMDKKLKIGATYRAENSFSIGPTYLTMLYLSDTGEQNLNAPWLATFHFLFGYSPTTYAAGVAYDFKPFPLTVSFDLELQQWSQFEYAVTNLYHYSPTEPLLKGYVPLGPEFNDVINASIGLEYRITDVWTLTSGYQYMPTPVPDQSNWISNYLDMDKQLFSVGINYAFKNLNPPSFMKTLDGIELGTVFQYIMCEDYTVYKEGEIDGWAWTDQQSYKVEGDVFVLGLSFKIAF